jgi:uncharacterized protein YfdQ (DUF2303 family)
MEINQVLIDALRVQPFHGTAVIPAGMRLVPKDINEAFPDSQRGVVSAESLESLVRYVRAFNKPGQTFIFPSIARMSINAVMDWNYADGTDDREPAEAGWADHRVEYPLEFAKAFSDWKAISGKVISQAAFAEFIEEHLENIVAPSAADVLTVALTIQGKRNIDFSNVVSLANGDKSIQWAEKTDAKAAGDIRVPSEITLRLPIFKGSEDATTFDIRALFRYRINDGRLSFEIKLMNVERIADLAFEQVVACLKTLFPESPVSPQIIIGHVAISPRAMVKNLIIPA